MIVFLADAHVSESPWTGRPIYGDAAYSLWQVTRWACRHRAAAVIGAGDLLDRQRNRSYPVHVWMQNLQRLQRSGIPFYFVEGQHDKDVPPWFASMPGAIGLDRQLVQIDGWQVYGLSFQPAYRLAEELRAIPDQANVFVAHQAWKEWLAFEGASQGSLRDVPHVRFIVSGDWHQSAAQRWQDGDRLVVAISPGSLCLQDIREPLPKRFVVLNNDGTLRWVRLRTRIRLTTPVLSTEAEARELLQNVETLLEDAARQAAVLPEQLRTPLWRISYRAGLEAWMDEIALQIGDRAHLFWDVHAADAPTTEHAAQLGLQSASLEACLLEALQDHAGYRDLDERFRSACADWLRHAFRSGTSVADLHERIVSFVEEHLHANPVR